MSYPPREDTTRTLGRNSVVQSHAEGEYQMSMDVTAYPRLEAVETTQSQQSYFHQTPNLDVAVQKSKLLLAGEDDVQRDHCFPHAGRLVNCCVRLRTGDVYLEDCSLLLARMENLFLLGTLGEVARSETSLLHLLLQLSLIHI